MALYVMDRSIAQCSWGLLFSSYQRAFWNKVKTFPEPGCLERVSHQSAWITSLTCSHNGAQLCHKQQEFPYEWQSVTHFLQVDFFERLAASGVKSVAASQVAAAPVPVSSTSAPAASATVASASTPNKENVDIATIMPIETYFVPIIEEIFT